MNNKLNIGPGEFSQIKADLWNALDYDSAFITPQGQLIDRLERQALRTALSGRVYESALDVGIGNGRLLEEYSPHVKRIVGLDISAKQLSKAREKAQKLHIYLTVKLSEDASQIPLPDSSFDLIVCTRVLQHLYNRQQAIGEFARLLKPEGELLLLTYNRYSIFGIKKLYENKFINPLKGNFSSPLSLNKELKAHGFEIKYYAGGLLGQPELFSENLSAASKSMIIFLERFSQVTPLKFFGGRQVVRACLKS